MIKLIIRKAVVAGAIAALGYYARKGLEKGEK